MTRKQKAIRPLAVLHKSVCYHPATCEKCGLTLPHAGEENPLLRMFEASAGDGFAKSCRKAATHMPTSILIRNGKLPDPEVLVRTIQSVSWCRSCPELSNADSRIALLSFRRGRYQGE